MVHKTRPITLGSGINHTIGRNRHEVMVRLFVLIIVTNSTFEFIKIDYLPSVFHNERTSTNVRSKHHKLVRPRPNWIKPVLSSLGNILCSFETPAFVWTTVKWLCRGIESHLELPVRANSVSWAFIITFYKDTSINAVLSACQPSTSQFFFSWRGAVAHIGPACTPSKVPTQVQHGIDIMTQELTLNLTVVIL